MPEYTTKVNEYTGSRGVLIRDILCSDNPTVVVLDDEGEDLVEIDLNELITVAGKRGAFFAIKVEDDYCNDRVEDGIIDHMENQPCEVKCSACGEDVPYVATVHHSDLTIEVDTCDCKKEGSNDAQDIV